MDVDAATQSMIDNLPSRTGRSLAGWFEVLDAAAPEKHGEAMALLKGEPGLSHGYANLVVSRHRARATGPVAQTDLVDAQYAGRKAGLRPVYERLVAEARLLGHDVEVAPKKTSVSLRRSKQFALVEAPSAARVQLGLNLRGVEPNARLLAATGMCTHRVDLTAPDEVDDEVLGWLRQAYDRA